MSTWVPYTFPSSLSLSRHAVLGSLLADIPLCSVGLLSFGVLTFYLVLRRVNVAHIFLFSSVIIAFLAAILDLTQNLLHERGQRQPASVNRLSIAREVFFSVATGLRFLYFWAFVAQCPRGESLTRRKKSTGGNSIFVMKSHAPSVHSGSWQRWGLVGLMLQWVLMGTAIAIMLLQIIWRTLPAFHHNGPVYAVESALEIIASAVFIIKLILNTLIAETPSRWRTLSHYTAMIVALVLNAGLGIGNLVYFAFSESTLGRFLLAIEIYIVIVFSLIWTFFPFPLPQAFMDNDNKRASSFRGLRISFGEPPMRPIDAEGGDPILPQQDTRPAMAQRMSSATRLSSWVMRRASNMSIIGRNRSALSRDESGLFYQDDAPRIDSPSFTEKGGNTLTYDPSAIMAETKQSARWRDPMYNTMMNSPVDTASPDGRAQFTSLFTNSPLEQANPIVRPSRAQTRSPTIASYYGNASVTSPSTVRANVIPPGAYSRPGPGTDSPIYGLNGTLRGGLFSPADVARSENGQNMTSSRSSGFSTLLREQSELEKSIAALRVFASSRRASESNFDSDVESRPERESSANFTNGHSRGSLSVKSEFSLSIFPEPPLGSLSDPSSQQVPSAEQISQSVQSADLMLAAARSSVDLELLPPRMPAAMYEQTLPSSTRNSEDIALSPRERTDSAGTRYDVTSFIGDLTSPGHRKETSSASMETIRPSVDNDNESEPGSATLATATIVTLERTYSKTQKLSLDGGGRLPPIDTSFNTVESATSPQNSTPYTSSRITPDVGTSQATRTLTRSPSRIFSTSPTVYTRAAGARATKVGGRFVGLPAGPKSGISGPARQSMEEYSTTAYERPRPAPSV